MIPPLPRRRVPHVALLPRPILLAATLLLGHGCRSEVWVEGPDERAVRQADSLVPEGVAVDTVYRPAPIDSVGASFAWLVDRPPPRVTQERSFPESPLEAARQYVRALAQTGSSAEGTVGVGEVGYERAFTYVHPSVRGRRSWQDWAPGLSGIVRPTIVRLEPVEADSARVFAELLVLREVEGQSLLGLYYGHFAAAPGDNGWQVTAARFASEDWVAPLGQRDPWRYDRAGAARAFAAEDSAYGLDLVRLQSGEWVPLARPAPTADLTLGLPRLP